MISISAKSYYAGSMALNSIVSSHIRKSSCPSCGASLAPTAALSCGNVAIDEDGDVQFRGRTVPMTRRERDLASALIRAQGRWLTRGALVDALGIDINDSTISKYVQRLRLKFKAMDPDFDQICCGKGFGTYRWLKHDR